MRYENFSQTVSRPITTKIFHHEAKIDFSFSSNVVLPTFIRTDDFVHIRMQWVQCLFGQFYRRVDVLRNVYKPIRNYPIRPYQVVGTCRNREPSPIAWRTSGSSFTLVKTTPSRLNKDVQHFKYQQYHQGLKVVGGGYTVSAMTTDGPGDPCAVAYLLAPNIFSGISVSTNPSITSGSLSGILQSDGTVTSELAIALNLSGNCQYRLVWEARYQKGGTKVSWVDAQTGAVLKTSDAHAHNTAPTVNYGPQDLDDSVVGGVRTLISEDGVVRSAPGSPTSVAAFGGLVIPTNADINADWTTAQAVAGVYQSHYVTTSVLPALSDAGIDFESVRVAFDATFIDNARSWNDFDLTTVRAFLQYGRTAVGNRPVATFDAAAHELGHAYMFDYIFGPNIGTRTIHEALADLIGTYAEADAQGFTDWVMGDDDPAVAGILTDRDLENPVNNCWNATTQGLADPYPRGGPIRRWFFLMAQGDAANGIIGQGLDKAITIALEALNYVDDTDDIDDFADATVSAAYAHFGPCSAEANTLRAAWSQVCINIPSVNCNFSIVGPETVCEEDDQLTMFVSGGPGSTGDYVWYFPYGWTVPGSQGNSYYGSTLYVTDFPKYNWYPKYFTITVRLLNGGPEKKKNVKLVDCNGDDPTCEEYNDFSGGNSGDRSATLNKTDAFNEAVANEIAKVKVFDVTGKLLFECPIGELNRKGLNYTGFLVFAYFDANNNFVKAEKTTILR